MFSSINNLTVTMILAVGFVLLLLGQIEGRNLYEREYSYGSREKGCGGSRLCCQGQNISCVAQGPRLIDPRSETCFCDEICSIIGDCCTDYKSNCPAVDCVLSDRWTGWSECDKRCGWGMQVRTKEILVQPLNGGKRCEEMIERRQCQGDNCKVARASEDVEQLKETGEIVPATLAKWREDSLYSPFADIRQNLFMEQDQYADLRRDRERPSYCAKYKITEARKSCQAAPRMTHQKDAGHDDSWIKKLVRGSTVCVECQQFAMHKSLGYRCFGHGVNQRETQWKAVTVPRCHGSWIMTSQHISPCTCDPTREVSFVFV